MSNKSTVTYEPPEGDAREIARIAPDSSLGDAELVGSRLGRFRIVSLLGKGGMGVVYLGEDAILQREVALKVLAPDVAGEPERRRRLLREARAAAAISHSSIAAVHEVGEANGLLYIAMERVQGESLRARLNRGRLPIEEVLRIGEQVLEGLAKAHQAGIIHRDLKPENVMVDEEGRAKILDFGIAKFLEEGADRGQASTMLTREGRLLGTPSYMSPEQVAGMPVDARTDVFSFGIVLYEMVAGELPFRGSNLLQVFASIERDEPAPPSQKNASVGPDLERVILRCLKKDPAERFADAGEVLQDLRNKRTAAPAPRRAAKWSWLVALGAALAMAGFAGLSKRIDKMSAEASGASSAPLAAAPAAPIPTPITELPLPRTDNPKAIAAYQEGLQALRDGAWSNARAAFERSVDLESSFGAGYLRLALTSTKLASPADTRAAYRRAISLRDSLSERDRSLLDALSPIIQQDPPEPAEARKRLAALAQQSPLDAEWVALQGNSLFAPDLGPVETLDVAERCLSLDPRYADCLQMRATSLARLGRVREALDSFERCLAVSPAGNDCLRDRLRLHMISGQCAAMEADARLMISNDANAWETYRYLAAALLAQGHSEANVRAALDRAGETAPAHLKDWVRSPGNFAYLSGQFEEAKRFGKAKVEKLSQSPFDDVQREILYGIVSHEEALGRTREAGKAAEDYLGRREVLTRPFVQDIEADATLFSEKRRLDAGSITRGAFVAARAAYVETWEKRLSPDMRGLVWLFAYASLARTPEEAKEALDAKPELKPLEYYVQVPTGLYEAMGRLYLLAGLPAQAIVHLERALSDCGFFLRSIEDTLDHYHLGLAREALSNTKGACDSYRVVLERWGHAKPRVPAAEDARARAKGLGCASASRSTTSL